MDGRSFCGVGNINLVVGDGDGVVDEVADGLDLDL